MEILDFFIASAHAQDAAPQGSLMSFLPLIIIFVIFYFYDKMGIILWLKPLARLHLPT